MTTDEFVSKIVGVSYKNRGHDFDSVDCFGVVYLYFRHVVGVIPSMTSEYSNGDSFSLSFNSQLSTGEWDMVDNPSGGEVVFMMFNGEIPLHCGVMIDDSNCIHAMGDPVKNTGQVMLWKISQLKRYLATHSNGRLEYYKWSS